MKRAKLSFDEAKLKAWEFRVKESEVFIKRQGNAQGLIPTQSTCPDTVSKPLAIIDFDGKAAQTVGNILAALTRLSNH